MRDDLPARIKNLLSTELGIYATLRTMVSRELEAIVLNEDMEELLQILQEKQALISRLQLLADSWGEVLAEAGVEEVRGMDGFWDQLSSCLPAPYADEFAAILQETRSISEDLMKAEAHAQEALEKHVDELRTKLASMTRGRDAFIGYTKMGGSTFEP
ncbi:flagellar export chaperone FlgN [Fretibacterium sp. OH1220_COT-178]|uniref:flagellar export chaperone FlgN n=1 Tax=Fretibacterium sp. OH1220_COT-178 TaxID=2491047 RepID=UPI000F5E51CB|nr:flagellar export chaperone FlgN [Fretibacterium sp. OH1220_COT-178]RRD65850.1 hypothetical protein EII26_01960 [Fretibacterium sp. OH1220_COT-178]